MNTLAIERGRFRMLLEEYREAQEPHFGRLDQFATFLCFFTLAAGIWLFVMENLLRHQGYLHRSGIAFCIVLQSAVTLLWLLKRDAVILRRTILAGTLALLWIGGTAIQRMLSAPHFEGFVVIIAAALIMQSIVTWGAWCQRPNRRAV